MKLQFQPDNDSDNQHAHLEKETKC